MFSPQPEGGFTVTSPVLPELVTEGDTLDEAFANSPLAKQARAQSDQLAAQGQQMQSNARLQRLMQLGQAKHCDKR